MTGTNKTKNYPVHKTIRINEHQLKNWDPMRIRLFLIRDKKEQDEILLGHKKGWISFEKYHKLEFDYNQLLKNYEKYQLEQE